MKEITFLKKNREKWEGYERFLSKNPANDPDRLADLFVELTDDLSYARTYYPGSKTERYVNGLTAQVHQYLYRNKKERGNRIIRYWTHEFPEMFRSYHKQLLYAFIMFALGFIIGGFSEYYDPSFVRTVMGDSYVNMTEEFIESGDPMAVYKQQGETDMFFSITFNNIRVAFLVFVAGMMLSVGTALVLFHNALRIGAFLMMFYDTEYFREVMLTVWIHGTIEISVIIIAGAGGLVMGNGILFPETFSRKVSFVKGAVNGVKILIATLPLFVLAGFLEGFVTRRTDMPEWLSLTIILGSLALIVGYFVIRPILVSSKSKQPALTHA